ncbi:MAG: prepilin-type N-terminal cleavage/methylation domain-containing protein [Fimbriimonadaceae bacterium]|nr:prepilin-type N-terminal cleavage/methylation domain-containing protein [Chthonomonadaceae bacterium]MCO5296489.1 prepilin-type N-terminal cleavage/methylation domain-containing protein [Fimbriimonadaceae bacterium]
MLARTNSRAGFSLVEMMVVVLILAILLAIAVPQWYAARGKAHQKVCMTQLREIDGAKEFYAAEHRLPPGAPVTEANLWPVYLKGSAFPACPAGGTYVIQPIGTAPTCSLAGAATFPHAID